MYSTIVHTRYKVHELKILTLTVLFFYKFQFFMTLQANGLLLCRF